MMGKFCSISLLSLLAALPQASLAEQSSWASVLCTYTVPNQNAGDSTTTIRRYGGQISSFTEITREEEPKELKFAFHLYINSADKSVFDGNKQRIQGQFEGDNLEIYAPSSGNDTFKIKIMGKDHSSSKIYIKNANGVAHINGGCKTERIDTCVLFPDVCRPSTNRGF